MYRKPRPDSFVTELITFFLLTAGYVRLVMITPDPRHSEMVRQTGGGLALIGVVVLGIHLLGNRHNRHLLVRIEERLERAQASETAALDRHDAQLIRWRVALREALAGKARVIGGLKAATDTAREQRDTAWKWIKERPWMDPSGHLRRMFPGLPGNTPTPIVTVDDEAPHKDDPNPSAA